MKYARNRIHTLVLNVDKAQKRIIKDALAELSSLIWVAEKRSDHNSQRLLANAILGHNKIKGKSLGLKSLKPSLSILAPIFIQNTDLHPYVAPQLKCSYDHMRRYHNSRRNPTSNSTFGPPAEA